MKNNTNVYIINSKVLILENGIKILKILKNYFLTEKNNNIISYFAINLK